MKKIIIAIIIILVAWFGYRAFQNQKQGQQESTQVQGEGIGSAPKEAEFELDASEDQQKVFDIEGVNFAFSVQEIRVKKGDTIRINFTSKDGFHNFVIDEFGAATEQVSAGNSSIAVFVADKAGEFEYYCSVGNHRAMGMVGKLIVEE